VVKFRYVLSMLLDLVITESAIDDIAVMTLCVVLWEWRHLYYLDHCAVICVLQFTCLLEHSAAWLGVYNIFDCHML
jgi:hypothetical protein